MTRQEFINKFYPYAEKAGQELGVNPLYILAQWGLETGWSENYAHNLAGIGAFDNPSARQTPYGYAYPSYQDFTNAYVRLVKSGYKEAVGAQTMADFARGLKAGGWASDPNYVQKLVSVYNSFLGIKKEPFPNVETGTDTKISGPSATKNGTSPMVLAGGAIILALVLAAGVALLVAGGLRNA